MDSTYYPTLYQINTRAYLAKISLSLGRKATLADIPDEALDDWANKGFNWIWLLGIWQTGAKSREIARSLPELVREFKKLLPDFTEGDISGSCFAVSAYTVHYDFGGEQALADLHKRLKARGLKLMLDFVPNHTAQDHPWVQQHPDFYVTGNERDLQNEPQNYTRLHSAEGEKIFAYGRDPNFDGWSDTLQLNYSNPALQAEMIKVLTGIAEHCDGIRCDMAMLVLPEVFARTWKLNAEPFWPKAIATIKRQHAEFIFMAEVYWDLEAALQAQGFDYCYDKSLYDLLRSSPPQTVRQYLEQAPELQKRLVRFMENHDERRAATAFPLEQHRAAAIITYLLPGLRFFHNGQFEGYTKKLPIQLRRGPREHLDPSIFDFYMRLLTCLKDSAFRTGTWQLLDSWLAWDGNWTTGNFIAYGWTGKHQEFRLVVVNYTPYQSQCYVHLPVPDLGQRNWQLADLMGKNNYYCKGEELAAKGLYLDMIPWGYHVFQLLECNT